MIFTPNSVQLVFFSASNNLTEFNIIISDLVWTGIWSILGFNEPKRTHVTPLFISLHWLPVAARIKFKTLMLAYRTTTCSAPSYFHSLLRIYIPSRSLRSASERRLVVPSQRGSKSLSRTFSFTIPGWWNNLPTPIRNAGSLSIFKQQLKTHLFRHYLTSS